jgi:hypothetical protein
MLVQYEDEEEEEEEEMNGVNQTDIDGYTGKCRN